MFNWKQYIYCRYRERAGGGNDQVVRDISDEGF